MKKCCVVLTKSQILYIEQHDGISFSEKLRMIVERDRLLHGENKSDSNSEIRKLIEKYPQLSLFD